MNHCFLAVQRGYSLLNKLIIWENPGNYIEYFLRPEMLDADS
jgi:hypothetical protein